MAFFKFGNFDAVIYNSGSISESSVNELIEQNNNKILTQVEQKVENTLTEAQTSGRFDDTKVYNTYSDMVASEPQGRTDVLYVIITDEEDKGTRYIWDGTQYVSIQDTITKTELENIVK